MRTNIVLIDSENVKPESIEKLKHEHFRVVVFVGTNQKRLDFAIVNAVHSLGSNGSYVQISGKGPNALDFHVAYYIGKLSAANPDAYFHIISKDKGFDPLIKHLKEQKIFCARSSSVSEIPLVKSSDKLPPKERAADFYEKRIASAKARPATVTSLQSAILSHFHKLLSPEEVANVVKALKQAGHVVVNGKKVAYPERAQQLIQPERQ
ncbi:MAG TPA: PIN domain-containing protein [Pyrinomonadaceae bacterium]|nr:PIN domain-containing protein [Pyrinomonadaceae bacterium]